MGCSSDDWDFSAGLPSGNYRVLFKGGRSSYEVQRTLAVTSHLPGLVFDIPLHEVAGMLLEDGPQQAGTYIIGTELVLSGAQGDWPTRVCESRTGERTFRHFVPAGTYDVTVRLEVSARVQRGLVVDADLPSLTLSMRTLPILGTLSLGGSVPVQAVCATSGSHRVAFINRDDGLTTLVAVVCWNGSWRFVGKLVPGVYDVWLEGAAKSGITTARTLLREGLQVTDAPLDVMLDAPLSHVSGRILDQGVPLMGRSCSYQPGLGRIEFTYLHVTEAQSGREEQVPVRCTEGWRYDAYLPPGSYSLRGLQTSSISDLGNGTFLPEPSSLRLSEPMTVQDLEVNTRTLEVTLKQSGAAIIDGNCSWADNAQGRVVPSHLLFREPSTGKEFRLPILCKRDETLIPWRAVGKIQPGVYHVFLVASPTSSLSGTYYLADAVELH